MCIEIIIFIDLSDCFKEETITFEKLLGNSFLVELIDAFMFKRRCKLQQANRCADFLAKIGVDQDDPLVILR